MRFYQQVEFFEYCSYTEIRGVTQRFEEKIIDSLTLKD